MTASAAQRVLPTEDPPTKVEAFRRGANDYVVKLPSALELHARVRYHATACQSAREREASFQALLESRAAEKRPVRVVLVLDQSAFSTAKRA